MMFSGVDLFRKMFELAARLRAHHRHEVIGLDHVPRQGPALIVVNHSLATYDIILLQAAVMEATGRKPKSLAGELFFKVPGLGSLVQSLGGVEGRPTHAMRMLKEGELVYVAPGGMREALRPSTEKYRILWNTRMGFARIAIKTGTPIILGACPSADDLYHVYPNAITKLMYQYLRVPVFFMKGTGIAGLLPRPVKLTHYLSEPILPPTREKTSQAQRVQLRAFHAHLIKRMEALMAYALEQDAQAK